MGLLRLSDMRFMNLGDACITVWITSVGLKHAEVRKTCLRTANVSDCGLSLNIVD